MNEAHKQRLWQWYAACAGDACRTAEEEAMNTYEVNWDTGAKEYSPVHVWVPRMNDTAYNLEARHWWARGWCGLRKRGRRRLHRRPELLARHRAWNEERGARLIERFFALPTWMVTEAFIPADAITAESLLPMDKILQGLGNPQDFDGATLSEPLSFEEEPLTRRLLRAWDDSTHGAPVPDDVGWASPPWVTRGEEIWAREGLRRWC